MSGPGFFDYGVGDRVDAVAEAFLGEATVDDWSTVIAHCERRRFRRGEVVVRVGEIDRSLVIVIEGELETVAERKGRLAGCLRHQPDLLSANSGSSMVSLVLRPSSPPPTVSCSACPLRRSSRWQPSTPVSAEWCCGTWHEFSRHECEH